MKLSHLIPIPTTIKAEDLTKLYFEHIYRLHGHRLRPRHQVHRGILAHAMKTVEMDLMMPIMDQPQTDGQSECLNRSALQNLRH